MAKFRDSLVQDFIATQAQMPIPPAEPVGGVHDRSIGDIIAETRNLSAEQVERILAYQRRRGVRFGEAAVALGFASVDDVLFALAQQFHYPYAAEEERNRNPELVTLNQPFSPASEAIRAMRSQVLMRVFNEQGRPSRKAVAIISPDSGDGKSYFAANLAVSLAQLGGRTLLIDADLRGPRQHAVFGLGSAAGLSTVLSGRAETQVVQQVAGIPSLFVLPGGSPPPNPLELVERPAFSLLLRELISKFDHVIVDTPAAAHGADATVIAARCGAALVVARKNETRAAHLQQLVSSFAHSSASVVGVVLNEY